MRLQHVSCAISTYRENPKVNDLKTTSHNDMNRKYDRTALTLG
jgi:hypothetical protein